MSNNHLIIKKSPPLSGKVDLLGAKNAVLPIMASLILTNGISILHNVPNSSDIQHMIMLLRNLGASVLFDQKQNMLTVDTMNLDQFEVSPEIMSKMRASILVMGPLLSRFGKAKVALPGGCLIGARPIDFHLKGFKKINTSLEQEEHFVHATFPQKEITQKDRRIIFEYPSVGATENLMICATLLPGTTTIVNTALEPEVLDLVAALQKMGAKIDLGPGLMITITGVTSLAPIEHEIIPDRLEAGSLLLATAITGGNIELPNARPDHMDLFLEKLKEMGHTIIKENGITLHATKTPQAVNLKTNPYPGFPTDLQAPTMATLCLADGISEIEETVFENRLMHAEELKKMGAQITVKHNKAIIRGVDELYGHEVIASDIRASCALVIAGLAAQGTTKMTGIHHWKRGYEQLDKKIINLGGYISKI